MILYKPCSSAEGSTVGDTDVQNPNEEGNEKERNKNKERPEGWKELDW